MLCPLCGYALTAFELDCPRCSRLPHPPASGDRTIFIDPVSAPAPPPQPDRSPSIWPMVGMVAGMLVIGLGTGIGMSRLTRKPPPLPVTPQIAPSPPPAGFRPAGAGITPEERAAYQAQWRNYVIATEQDKWATQHNKKLRRRAPNASR